MFGIPMEFLAKNWKWIAALLIFTGWTCGVMKYTEKQKDNEWIAKLATSPTKHIEVELPPEKIEQPKQHLEGQALTPTDTGRQPGRNHPIIRTITVTDSTCQDIVDSLQILVGNLQYDNENLRQIAKKTLEDTLGGRHDLTFYPITRLFVEDYFPPPQIIRRKQITDSTYVLVSEEHNWMFGLNFSYLHRPPIVSSFYDSSEVLRQTEESQNLAGFGASLGRKPLILSGTYYDKSVWEARINLLWEF